MSEFSSPIDQPNLEPSMELAVPIPYDQFYGPEVQQSNFINRAYHVGKRALEGAVIAFVVGPTNEGARFAAFTAAQAATHNPVAVAAVYGGATFAIETAAAVVGADLLDSESSKKGIQKINEKLTKIGVTEETKLNPVVKAGVAFLGGSAIAEFVEHREDPQRTRRQNVEFGMKTAVWLTGACAVQGYLLSEGIAKPNPLTIGGAAVAVGSVLGAAKWAAGRIKKAS